MPTTSSRQLVRVVLSACKRFINSQCCFTHLVHFVCTIIRTIIRTITRRWILARWSPFIFQKKRNRRRSSTDRSIGPWVEKGHPGRSSLCEKSVHSHIEAKGCCMLKAERRWCVSGTIIQNSLNDVYGLLKFLRHEPWCENSFWKASIGKVEDMQLSLDRVRRLLRPIMLRRTKHSMDKYGKPILTLPPIEMKTVAVQFSPAEREFYSALHPKSCNKNRWTYSKASSRREPRPSRGLQSFLFCTDWDWLVIMWRWQLNLTWTNRIGTPKLERWTILSRSSQKTIPLHRNQQTLTTRYLVSLILATLVEDCLSVYSCLTESLSTSMYVSIRVSLLRSCQYSTSTSIWTICWTNSRECRKPRTTKIKNERQSSSCHTHIMSHRSSVMRWKPTQLNWQRNVLSVWRRYRLRMLSKAV